MRCEFFVIALLVVLSVRLMAEGQVESDGQVAPVGFEPIRYRPMPVAVQGLAKHELELNGTWKIDPSPGEGFRERPLGSGEWHNFHVPGQWFDVPQDKPVAVARQFTIPKTWAGYRIILRFDAIHAGTHYWLNGTKLGYSENLFTPVEWDVTDAAQPGKVNRLDLEMKVATDSERLSYSSAYAFHNLGGIDRSVRLYALPKIHLKDMRILTDLDSAYRDAEMKLNVTVDSHAPLGKTHGGMTLHIGLLCSNGKPAKLSTSSIPVGPIAQGPNSVEASVRVIDPLKWSAEKPTLYKLAIELREGSAVIERVERSIGFRKIEVRGSLVYINGRRVKFAGACHHEFDPLTGRADTMRHAEQDVKLAKDLNLNYLRTSHYPPTQELLDAADRLGMYVEVEAPFCWVQPTDDLTDIKHVLEPTSAMVDYCHTHPSVIVWSVANESNFNKFFEFSDRLIKQLDPTRPTTFNNPDPKRICDIANAHYPPMPYDEALKDDPRPLFLGEYLFPVCHEQTDVNINPGLRELWGHGHADPESDYAKLCAQSFNSPTLLPGAKPGAWSHIYHSNRVIGGAIWALIDEPFYFADGKRAGYAWHHGFWGMLDGWRRPKPEAWLCKLMFSPVWFPARHVTFSPGQDSVRVPVENRYSFTDLKELVFSWEIGDKRGKIKANVLPGTSGELELPIPPGTKEGEQVTLRVTNKAGELINALAIHLGKETRPALPQPTAGAPKWSNDGKVIVVEGNGFSLALDRATGNFDVVNASHKAPIITFPALRVTRHDYGDLAGPNAPPYAVFPDAKTRVVDEVWVLDRGGALQLTIKDHYDHFAGYVRWLIDKNGVGKLSYDYTYTGDNLDTREIGVGVVLRPECDTLKWNRWSEWDIFPDDSISRTKGTAKARRPESLPDVPEITPPTWPWSLDQTELGTNDFRSAKFNIYEASLSAPDGSGFRVNANADAHIRACLAKNGVNMYMLKQCPLGPFTIHSGDRLKGEFTATVLLAKQ